MHLTIFLLAAGAILATAQTSTTSVLSATSTTSSVSTASSSCAAQAVLNQCILTEQAQIDGCVANDYSCLCQQYGNLLTCYNNCPNDPGVYSVQQEKTQQCEAAQAYGTTTLMVAPKTTSSTSSSVASSIAATSGFASASPSGTNTASAGAASATATAGAAPVLDMKRASGLLAILAAGFGLFM